jgi:hypothetical protein
MKLSQLTSFGTDDMLKIFGLQARREDVTYIAPALALFGLGALLGAVAGMIFAPRSMRSLKNGLADRVQQTVDRAVAGPPKGAEHGADGVDHAPNGHLGRA